MKLYKTANSILELNRLFESGVILEEVTKDTLEAMHIEFDEKANNIACLIKTIWQNPRH